MEGKLYFAPDPFVMQKWQGFKSCDCIIRGQFMKIKERQKFKISSSEEMSIPLGGSSARKVTHHKKHLFELKTSSSSKYLFFANSKEVAEQWIKEINALTPQNEQYQTAETAMMNLSNTTSIEASNGDHRIVFNGQGPVGGINVKKDDHLNASLHAKTALAPPKASSRASKHRRSKHAPVITHNDRTDFFGVPLQHCKMSSTQQHQHVPLIVVACVEMIERQGLEHQGIYRVPGNGSLVNSLCHDLNTSKHIDVHDERWSDVNVVTSLLKMFFRKLPDPLITNQLYRSAIEAVRNGGGGVERREQLKKVLVNLPLCHRDTFKYMAAHLGRLSKYESVNKMDIKNLSIIFGPTLVCSREEESMKYIVLDMPDQCRVVETIVTNIDYLFKQDKTLKLESSSDVSWSEENSRCMVPERKESCTDQLNTSTSNDGLSNNTFFSTSSLFSAFAPLINTFEKFEVTDNLEKGSVKNVKDSQQPSTLTPTPASLRRYRSLNVEFKVSSSAFSISNQSSHNSSQHIPKRNFSCNDLQLEKLTNNKGNKNDSQPIIQHSKIQPAMEQEDLGQVAVEHLKVMSAALEGLRVRQQVLEEERRSWQELKEALSLRCAERIPEMKIC